MTNAERFAGIATLCFAWMLVALFPPLMLPTQFAPQILRAGLIFALAGGWVGYVIAKVKR